jgi:hypothetical protein
MRMQSYGPGQVANCNHHLQLSLGFQRRLVLIDLIVSLVLPDAAFAQASIQVTRSAFALRIKDREPAPALSNSTVPAGKRLCFWTEFLAGKKALDELDHNGQLHIVHVWHHGLFETKPLDADISTEEWSNAEARLREEVHSKGASLGERGPAGGSYRENIA